MRELIEEFIYRSYQEVLSSCKVSKLKNTVEMNKERLKRNLSKEQQKLLLRIEDAKDLIAEEWGYESFIVRF